MPGRIHPLAQYLMVLSLMIGAWAIYARVAVPFIEGPTRDVRRTTAVAPDSLPEKKENKSRLLRLLPTAAWEMGECKTLFTSQGTLLCQEMVRLDDEGNYSLTPFTMIMNDHESGTAFARALDPNVPPTVLRCGQAKLKFDGPISLTGKSKTKMEAAWLNGEVTIFRPSPPVKIGAGQNGTGQSSEGDQTLKVITENVQVSTERIVTLSDVAFSFGPHRGNGRNLSIELLHDPSVSKMSHDFSTIEGVRKVRLATLDRLYLVPETRLRTPLQDPNAVSATPASASDPRDSIASNDPFTKQTSPIEIQCSGPFEFDYERYQATFLDKVYVEQVNEFRDNLSCHRLDVMFTRPDNHESDFEEVTATPSKNAMAVDRLIATGNSSENLPAVVLSPSRKMKVTGDTIEFDVAARRMFARSEDQVVIIGPEFNIRSRDFSYAMNADGRLGDLDAAGPGELYHKTDDPKENLFTRWQNRLTIRDRVMEASATPAETDQPVYAQKLIVIDGNAEVLVQGQTEVKSDRLNIALFEVPRAELVDVALSAPGDRIQDGSSKLDYLPAEVFADQEVTLRSPTADGVAGKINVTWPQPTPAAMNQHFMGLRRSANPTQIETALLARGSRHLTLRPQLTDDGMQFQTKLRSLADRRQTAANQADPSIAMVQFLDQESNVGVRSWMAQPRHVANSVASVTDRSVTFDGSAEPVRPVMKQYIRFQGDDVRMKLENGADKPQLADLEIDGHVKILQFANRTSTEKPLKVTGSRMRVVPQDEKMYRMLVAGSSDAPAVVDAKGLTLSGEDIHLDQEANKVWVAGVGEMKVRQSELKEDGSKPATADAKPGSAPSASGDSAVASMDLNQMAPTGDIDLKWDGGMVFDGSKIYFERNVMMTSLDDGSSEHSSVTKTLSQALSIALAQRVDFSQLSGDRSIGKVDLEEMVLVNHIPESMRVFAIDDATRESERRFNAPDAPIIFQNESFDTSGKLIQQQRIAVPQATINARNSTVFAKGPGKIFTHQLVRKDEEGGLGGLPSMSRAPGQQRSPTKRRSGRINFLQVNFEDRLVADLKDKQLNILGNIRTAFAPVKQFTDLVDPDGRGKLPEDGMRMQCESLQLNQWQPAGADKAQNEMVATGNTHIDSVSFEALSHRVTYNDGNDQVVVEGTPRSPAKVWHSPTPNAAKQQMLANKIIYHPSTGMAETQGVQSMNVSVKK